MLPPTGNQNEHAFKWDQMGFNDVSWEASVVQAPRIEPEMKQNIIITE